MTFAQRVHDEMMSEIGATHVTIPLATYVARSTAADPAAMARSVRLASLHVAVRISGATLPAPVPLTLLDAAGSGWLGSLDDDEGPAVAFAYAFAATAGCAYEAASARPGVVHLSVGAMDGELRAIAQRAMPAGIRLRRPDVLAEVVYKTHSLLMLADLMPAIVLIAVGMDIGDEPSPSVIDKTIAAAVGGRPALASLQSAVRTWIRDLW